MMRYKFAGRFSSCVPSSQRRGMSPIIAMFATLVYEQEPLLAGVWIATGEVQPSAAPRPRS